MDYHSNILRRIKERNSYIIIEEDSLMEPIVKPRKRRLDHLTWEEKIQRKKLKNRVAAQTSRDRKKAKMEQLEQNFDDLMAQNKRVLTECENLKNLNEKLRAENADLQKALRQPCINCNHHQSRSVEYADHLSGSTESEFLLQQGLVANSAAALRMTNKPTATLLKILLACLLYKTSSTNLIETSTLVPLTNSHKAFSQISLPILIQMVKTLNYKIQLMDPVTLERWWGRHQNNWNPIEMSIAA